MRKFIEPLLEYVRVVSISVGFINMLTMGVLFLAIALLVIPNRPIIKKAILKVAKGILGFTESVVVGIFILIEIGLICLIVEILIGLIGGLVFAIAAIVLVIFLLIAIVFLIFWIVTLIKNDTKDKIDKKINDFIDKR